MDNMHNLLTCSCEKCYQWWKDAKFWEMKPLESPEGKIFKMNNLKYFEDLFATIKWELANEGYAVKFTIFQWNAYRDKDNRIIPDYQLSTAQSYPSNTNNIDEAEICFTGTIKWDGCSDWNCKTYYHCCSLKDIQFFSKIMEECWDIAGEEMSKHWDED